MKCSVILSTFWLRLYFTTQYYVQCTLFLYFWRIMQPDSVRASDCRCLLKMTLFVDGDFNWRTFCHNKQTNVSENKPILTFFRLRLFVSKRTFCVKVKITDKLKTPKQFRTHIPGSILRPFAPLVNLELVLWWWLWICSFCETSSLVNGIKDQNGCRTQKLLSSNLRWV